MWMPKANLVDIVAMKIHVAAALGILQVDPFCRFQWRQTRSRHSLMQKAARIRSQQVMGSLVQLSGLPEGSLFAEVNIAFFLQIIIFHG